MKKRMRTCDASFKFRMGAGFPGDVNRVHPASIEPNINDGTNPVAQYGFAVHMNAAKDKVQGFVAADTAITKIYGVAVRPFPTQQATTAAQFGKVLLTDASPAPAAGAIDILREGYILVVLPAAQTPKKGDPVWVWCAVSGGGHVQGGFENAVSAGNTAAISNAYFNGSPDSNQVVEIVVFIN